MIKKVKNIKCKCICKNVNSIFYFVNYLKGVKRRSKNHTRKRNKLILFFKCVF